MSYCLNPDCPKPRNPDRVRVCRGCGAALLLKDRYRAIAPIGQGGFGRTFAAIDEDKPSKPRCVIKQFLPIAAQNPQQYKKALALFAQEAVRLEELGHHPQIPELLAYFQQEDTPYLVQEFIHGKNLADVLQAQGAFTEAQVRDVLVKLLPVLDFVHAHRVIHRDIKPGNVIVTAIALGMGLPRSGEVDWGLLQQALTLETTQGYRNFVSPSYRFNELLAFSLSQPPRETPSALLQRSQQLTVQFFRYAGLSVAQRQSVVADASRLVQELQQVMEPRRGGMAIDRLVLVDFGAAKLLRGAEAVQTGTTIGSPEYVAPEQARGKAVFASDLYSLGVMAVQLLTQRSPYDLFDAAADRWVWRRFLPSPVSEGLGGVLDRLLERAIARRYATAAAVLQDLEGATVWAMPAIAPQTTVPMMPMAASPAGGSPVVQTKPPSFRIMRRPIALEPILEPVLEPAIAEPELGGRRRSQPQWRCVQRVDSPVRIHGLAGYAGDGERSPLVASSSSTAIRVWDGATLQPLRVLTGHLDIIPAIAFTPDGTRLISGSADKTIGVWDVGSGRRLATLALHTDTVLALAVSADGRWLASGSLYDPILLWDLQTGANWGSLVGHSSRVETLAFRPGGTDEDAAALPLLASGGADIAVKLWDLATGTEARSLEGHEHVVMALAFSPDGNWLASGSGDGTVRLWNVKTRRQRVLVVESGRVNGLAFSPDGKKLAIAADDLYLWTLASGKKIGLEPGHGEAVSAVWFGADEHTLVSTGSDRSLRLWRFE